MEVKEGLCTLYIAPNTFYNNVQEFNRDVSSLAIKTFAKNRPCRILDALSASGARAVRYALEVPNSTVVSNDLNPACAEVVRRNATLNNVHIETVTMDANEHMLQNKCVYDVVDLDPYGSASPFLYPALYSLKDSGLLCATFTDLVVLCGNGPTSCYTRYASIAPKMKGHHENAIRIALLQIERVASTQGYAIEPLLCFFSDFYIRLFVRIDKTRAFKVLESISHSSSLVLCSKCRFVQLLPFCTENYRLSKVPEERCRFCGGNRQIGGPIYASLYKNDEFIEECLRGLSSFYKTAEKIRAMLEIIRKEVDSPFVYSVPCLFSLCKASTCKLDLFYNALMNAGFKVSRAHSDPEGVKTDASYEVLIQAAAFLSKKKASVLVNEREFEVSGEKNVSKAVYLQNPETNWGPKQAKKVKKGKKTEVKK